MPTLHQPRRVCVMHECNTGELLAKAAFMHHADKRHDVLKQYVTLTGSTMPQLPVRLQAPQASTDNDVTAHDLQPLCKLQFPACYRGSFV